MADTACGGGVCDGNKVKENGLNMTYSKIYRKAAMLISDNQTGFCCGAIVLAGFRNDIPNAGYTAKDLFVEMFSPDGDLPYWWGETTIDTQQERFMLLCLAAEVLKGKIIEKKYD